MMILEPEIHNPLILSVNWSLHRFEIPASTFTRETKFLGRPFKESLHLTIIVGYGFVAYHMGERGELRHSPMSSWNPPPEQP